jgi:hypothetical protein
MNPLHCRPLVAAVLALAALGLVAAGPAPSPGRQSPAGAPPPVAAQAAASATPAPLGPAVRSGAGAAYAAGQYVGPGTCAAANCHGNAEPSQVYGARQDEFVVWFHQDPHRRAAEPLFNEQSRLIARNLRLATPPEGSPRCLVCHALDAPRSVQAVPLELADGISCESCHGPAGGWLARHNEAGWSHADSLAAGMADLRPPRARAQVCLSCHLGGPGHQVDHELLAAGHPELVFELDNYSESMPPHWLPVAPGDTARSRNTRGLSAWAVGQAEAFRQGLALLRHRASSERWPEFAELACDTCHHDLASGRWRQLRGYRHRAGLPSWSPARWAVLRHLVDTVAPSERALLDREVERLAAQVAQLNTPAPRLAETCDRIAAGLDRLLPRLAAAEWDERSARDLIAALAADRAYLEAADRESAEQTALALQSLVADLSVRQPRAAQGPLPQRVRALFAALDDPNRWDRQRFSELLAEVERAARAR